MLEGLQKCKEDLLDLPSYGELFGEAIVLCTRKLESKRRHFFSLKNRYGHGRTGRTIAAGPEEEPTLATASTLAIDHFMLMLSKL